MRGEYRSTTIRMVYEIGYKPTTEEKDAAIADSGRCVRYLGFITGFKPPLDGSVKGCTSSALNCESKPRWNASM